MVERASSFGALLTDVAEPALELTPRRVPVQATHAAPAGTVQVVYADLVPPHATQCGSCHNRAAEVRSVALLLGRHLHGVPSVEHQVLVPDLEDLTAPAGHLSWHRAAGRKAQQLHRRAGSALHWAKWRPRRRWRGWR